MTDQTFDYTRLRYIRTRGPDDKRPLDKWGGYGQDFDEAKDVYTHEEVEMMPDDNWAVVGVEDADAMSMTTLIFDLDVYKAPPEFDASKLEVPADTLLVKSQSGGFHLYFTVQGQHQDYNQSDFQMAEDLGWDIDIRGSAVGAHVVAPGDIPGVDTPYEIVQDRSIKNVLDPSDAAERIRFDGEPLLEFRPTNSADMDFDIDRDVEPPAEMPTCYHRGLQLREASPDEHPNSHKVNVLTALCGLYAGYDVETVAEHFIEYAPDNPDRETTEYHVRHIAEKIDRDEYSPPAISTLRNYGILNEDEGCQCEIPYHGDADSEDAYAQVWEWWSDARQHGDFGEESIIPDAALWHIAKEHTNYPTDELDEDVEELPDMAARRALAWLDREWADTADIDTEEEAVTKRDPPYVNPEGVLTWDGVRFLYEHDKEEGRYAAVRLLRARNHFLTPDDTEELHIYNDELGIFEPGAKRDVGHILDRELGSNYSTHEKNEIVSRLREGAVPRESLNAGEFDANLVCLNNGVLNLDTRELGDHDPKYNFVALVPHTYDPDARADEIESFLDDITRRDEDAQTLVEMLGNCLLDNYDYESFLVLFGEGSNGKSTFFEVARAFLGTDNVQSMTLQQITDNRFMASNLVGKWANIGEDLPAKKINDMGKLKDLTGGGKTTVEPKGKDAFELENRAKMMFAANDPPVLGERTAAIARRILPVRLPYQFTTDPDDGHKDAKKEAYPDALIAEEEMSGLLNLALDGLERLRANGDFSLPETNEERLEYYEQMSDHIKNFAINCLTNEGGERISKDGVYTAYTNFCKAEGFESVTRSTFFRQLQRTTLEVSQVRTELPNGERPRMVDNMTWTDTGRQYAPNYGVGENATAPTISSLAPGDDGISIEARVEEVDTDMPDAVAEKAKLADVTDTVWVTVFDDSNQPSLEAGQCYRFKNVSVDTYDGSLEVHVNENSGIEEISQGVGNAPSADPGDNTQLDAAADGGRNTGPSPEESQDEDQPENLRPKIAMYVRKQCDALGGDVPTEMVVGNFATDGYDVAHIQDAISGAKSDGSISEPEEGKLRKK